METLTLDEYNKLCVCEGCPSYVNCGELSYCHPTIGKSKCIKEEKGCICMSCPVSQKLAFKHGYFCTRGLAEEQEKNK